MNSYNDWLVEIEDRVANLTLNRPEKKNTLGTNTVSELVQIVKEVETIPEVAAIVIQGAGDGFSGGVDLNNMFGIWQKSKEEIFAYFQAIRQNSLTLLHVKKPMIAKIHNYCIAGGVWLALMCDFRVASTDAYFSLSEARLSLMTLQLTQMVKRVCGVNNTREMILLAENFNAEQALKYNLINKVVEKNELDAAVARYTDRFKQLPTLAVAENKLIINQEISDEESLKQEIEAQLRLMKTQDFQEAIQSFMQKREPNYIGK